MTKIEQELLREIASQGTVTFDEPTIKDFAALLGIHTTEVAAAKNALRSAGYVSQADTTFTGGFAQVRITDAGKAALRAP